MSASDETQAPAAPVSGTQFFESIGQKASQLDGADQTANQTGEDDDRVVEQIESLCMNCHENVRLPKGFLELDHPLAV